MGELYEKSELEFSAIPFKVEIKGVAHRTAEHISVYPDRKEHI